jgi:hypothetical protein
MAICPAAIEASGLGFSVTAFLLQASPCPSYPATIFLETSGSDLAAVIQQALANVFPDRVRPVELHRIQALDLDAARASAAFDPQ